MEAVVRVQWNDGKAKAVVAEATQKALLQAGHDIQAEAQKIVPHELGTLEGSATTEPDGKGGVRVSFGGPASAYAAVQHEDTSLRHAPGRSAKYLETPFKAKSPLIPRLVELTVKQALKGGGA